MANFHLFEDGADAVGALHFMVKQLKNGDFSEKPKDVLTITVLYHKKRMDMFFSLIACEDLDKDQLDRIDGMADVAEEADDIFQTLDKADLRDTLNSQDTQITKLKEELRLIGVEDKYTRGAVLEFLFAYGMLYEVCWRSFEIIGLRAEKFEKQMDELDNEFSEVIHIVKEHPDLIATFSDYLHESHWWE